MPKSTILIGSVSSLTLEFSKNVGEPVGNHRWAVSGRITDASDVVSLLCTGVYLTLAHVKDGEGLTVDDFRFDDLDIHFLFPFLSFVFLSIADFSDLSILYKCFFEIFLRVQISCQNRTPQFGWYNPLDSNHPLSRGIPLDCWDFVVRHIPTKIDIVAVLLSFGIVLFHPLDDLA